MNPESFELQPSNIPQPQLLDADPVTEDWPLPEPRRFEPKPVKSFREVFTEMAARCGL